MDFSNMTPLLAYEEMRLELELLSALLVFLIPFAKKKSCFILRCVSGFFLLSIICLLYFPIFHDKAYPNHILLLGIWYPFLTVCAIFYGKFCFVLTWCDSIFMTISAFATQNMVYVTLHQLIARFLFPQLRDHLILYAIVSLFFCSIIYGSIYAIFAKQLADCEGQLYEDTRRGIVFYCFMFVLMLITLFHFQNLFENFPDTFVITSCLMGVTFCVFLLSIEFTMFKSRRIYKENAKLEQFLHSSSKHYKMSKESIDIINRKCHDLKHQLKILENANEKERASYIDEARKDIMFYQQLVHSDNEVINTILAEKGLFCSEHDIHLSCFVDHVNLDLIRVADLYAILGNAIDNSIEYVEQFEDDDMRVINFHINQKNQFVSIQINNPYQGPALTHGNLPSTTKKDSSEHGFGLKSIKYLTEKYHGWMEIGTDGGIFTLQLMIPL